MLSCFVNLPTNFEVRSPANPFLSAACTLPFSIFPQHADSKPLPHSFKNIGGGAPFVPFWNPHRPKFHSRRILIKTTPLPATKVAFRSHRGYGIQAVRIQRYPSRPTACSDAQSLAGPPAGYKGNSPILESPVHHSFSGAIA